MRYYFDTEFIESNAGIELISIGIVSEENRSFYAESCNFKISNADEWVKENIIKKLKFYWPEDYSQEGKEPRKIKLNEVRLSVDTGEPVTEVFGSDEVIGHEIQRWLSNDLVPEFYAYYGSYDWVIFARLFGRLIDKPKHFPMWVIDLKQMMWERGLTKEWKRDNCPEPADAHNALVDAMWNKKLHESILSVKAAV